MKSSLKRILCSFLVIAMAMLPFQSGQAGMIGSDAVIASGIHAYCTSTSLLVRKRLGIVQAHIRRALDQCAPGEIRVVSVCAGQGHDLIGALRDHPGFADRHQA